MVYSSQHYQFRSSTSMGIHKITVISFFGGSTSGHAAIRDEYIDYDDITAYRYASGQGHVSGLKLSSPGSVISTPGTTGTSGTSGSNAVISVKASGTAARGTNCHFNLLINGTKVADKFVSTSETVYNFQTNMTAASIKNIGIQFDNDFYVASPLEDRNLKVTGVTIAGQTVNLLSSTITRPAKTEVVGTGLLVKTNGTLTIPK
ncbi:MAG: hypothetical protein HC905_25765 [Bacteroidales bacterium]|nr:hypothetical protein [Bacteroidales bacterium]